MANVKIADLSAGAVGTTILGTDIAEIQHDPGGAGDASKKSTISQLGLSMDVPAVEANRSATQSINSASPTAVDFTAADGYDTDTMHDPSSNSTRIIAKTAGLFFFDVALAFANNSDTAIKIIWFAVNGSGTFRPASQFGAAVSFDTYLHTSGVFKLAVNDYLEVIVYNGSVGAVVVQAGAICTALRVGKG